jgi:plasmid stability protein
MLARSLRRIRGRTLTDMLICMRTTINLPEALAQAAKARAAAEGRTLTSLIEEALRTVLAQTEEFADVEPLPEYGTPGGGFFVDLTDRDAVWTALDADGIK